MQNLTLYKPKPVQKDTARNLQDFGPTNSLNYNGKAGRVRSFSSSEEFPPRGIEEEFLVMTERTADSADAFLEDVPKGVLANNAEVATAVFLAQMDNKGCVGPEKDSVYGAAVALAQVARSGKWPATLTGLVYRYYILVLINILLQGFLLSMIGMEQLIMYPFAGQMHLCDYGKNIPVCPDGPNCKGPGGTSYTYPRLYDYDIWATRTFLRDSLKALFPDQAASIDQSVDPGEYGMENYYIRLVCCFLFMLSVVDDLFETSDFAYFLYYIPSEKETWIQYDVQAETANEESEPSVRFVCAGMPRIWKVINVVVILIPKIALWVATVCSGFHYLMETAGIVDVIVNAMALTFILNVDELVFEKLKDPLTARIMDRLEDFDLPDSDVDCLDGESIVARFRIHELRRTVPKILSWVVPLRLITTTIMTMCFTWLYYIRNCETRPDGSLVSADVKLPLDLSFHPFSLMFGIEPQADETSLVFSAPYT